MDKEISFWISYDLGIKGDYPGMYTWLDSKNSKECGDSVAYFRQSFKNVQTLRSVVEKIKSEISKNVSIGKFDRIYLVCIEKKSSKAIAKFLFGKRKRAPWQGFAIEESELQEDFFNE